MHFVGGCVRLHIRTHCDACSEAVVARSGSLKMKTNHELALQIVGAIVREWDPYSLHASGCPDAEFGSEIASVVAQIRRIKSETDATHALSRVFSSAFEPERFTHN